MTLISFDPSKHPEGTPLYVIQDVEPGKSSTAVSTKTSYKDASTRPWFYLVKDDAIGPQSSEKGSFITIDDRVVFVGGPGQGGGGSSGGAPLTTKLSSNPLTRVNEGEYKPGSYPSALMEVADDGRAIVKQDVLRRWGDEIPPKSTAEAEVLTYQISQAMGFDDLVPMTIERSEEGMGRFSVQSWVENASTGDELMWTRHPMGEYTPELFSEVTAKIPNEQFANMAVLDMIVGNHDRHSRNWIVTNDPVNPRLHAIDHGLAFTKTTGVARLGAALVGQAQEVTLSQSKWRQLRITPAHRQGAARLGADDQLYARIAKGFGEYEAIGFRERCRIIASAPNDFLQVIDREVNGW